MTKADLETKLAKAKRLVNKYNKIESELDILLWGDDRYDELLRNQHRVVVKLTELLGAKAKKKIIGVKKWI